MLRNVSLVLTCHHFTDGPIRPNVPAVVEIGGIQVKAKPEVLPAVSTLAFFTSYDNTLHPGKNMQKQYSSDQEDLMFNSAVTTCKRMRWEGSLN